MKKSIHKPLLKAPFSLSKKWRSAYELLWAMTTREIKARYKHTILGFLWVVLNPVLQMIVIGVVFSFFIRISIENYFLFLLSGLLLWNFFALSFTKATPAIVFELPLIEKAKFPREVIVLSLLLANLFHTSIAYVLFFLFLFVVGKLSVAVVGSVTIALGSVLIALIWVGVVLCGISLLTSALNVRFRDVNFIVQALVPLWFYATPLTYPLSFVPTAFHWVMWLNPLVTPVEVAHAGLGWGSFPPGELVLANLVVSLVILGIGVAVFRAQAPFFDDWI